MPPLPTRFLPLPSLRLAYCEHGSGPPLLLLHGNSGSKAAFHQYQTAFFPDFHTFALDSRGHGQSVSQDARLEYCQLAQDVIEFTEALALAPCAVVGYSDGGILALFLAHLRPELFSRLVAISPNYLVSGTEEGDLLLLQRIYRLMGALSRLGLPLKKHLVRWELMLRDCGLTPADLGAIHADLLILHAEKDSVKESHIREIAGLVSGAGRQQIPGCTHLNILNQPATVAAIRSYLTAAVQ